MDYTGISMRLKKIKREIFELEQVGVLNIQEKIQALKSINGLLKEQNALLSMRQAYIASQRKEMVSAA